jgi:hypothetical protein
MEKDIVFGVLNDMQVTPTTAERDAIEQRPTRSLAAFLAYSRGLEQEDAGLFDGAAQSFDDATRLDPNFGAARQKSTESHRLWTGARVTTATVESANGSALAMAEGLNPSPIAAATSGTTHGATQPPKDPSAGTGGDNVSGKVQVVTIPIHNP